MELFANVFSEVTFPGKSYAQLVTALGYLPEIRSFFATDVKALDFANPECHHIRWRSGTF